MNKKIDFLILIMPVFLYGMDNSSDFSDVKYIRPTKNIKKEEQIFIQKNNHFIKQTKKHYRVYPQKPMPQAEILVEDGENRRTIYGICSYIDLERVKFEPTNGIYTPKIEPVAENNRKKRKINPRAYYDSFKKEIKESPTERYNPYNRLFDQYKSSTYTLRPHTKKNKYKQPLFNQEDCLNLPNREISLIEQYDKPSFYISIQDNIVIKSHKKLKSNEYL